MIRRICPPQEQNQRGTNHSTEDGIGRKGIEGCMDLKNQFFLLVIQAIYVRLWRQGDPRWQAAQYGLAWIK